MTASAIGLVQLTLNFVLGGGLIAVWLKYRVQVRSENRVDFSTVLAAVEQQRNEAWTHIERQDERIRHLEDEVQGLRIARDLDPFPNWLVDLDGCYTFVNRPFEERFLEPQRKTRRDIIGKAPADVWPEHFCRTLKALDAAARKRPDGTARANTSLDVPGLGPCQVMVHKFPCRIKGVVVAYAGYITVIEPETGTAGLPEGKA